MVPGLVTRQTEGGIDDGGVSLWIRGNRASSGTTLTLVDGQERPIGMLAPEEIREIIVLKDAAAVGLYGMRAARGAILVNTRSGYVGKPRVEFFSRLTCQQPLSLPQPLDAASYAAYHNATRISDGQQPLYSAYDLALYRNHSDPEGHPDIAWLDKYYRRSWWAQNYSFSVTGGSNVNRYFMALSWQHQPGMFRVSDEQGYNTNNYSDRYTFRTNVETNLSATTRLNVNLFGWFRKCNSPYTDDEAIFSQLTHVPANAFPEYYIWDAAMRDQDGNEIAPVNGKMVAGDVYHSNPWARLNRSGYSSAISMYGSVRAALRQELDFILPDLYARAEVALDSQTSTNVSRTRSYAYYYPRAEGTWQKTGNDGAISTSVSGNSSTRYLTVNLRLEYAHSFGANNISGALFYEQFEQSAGTNIPNRVQSLNAYASWNRNHRYGVDATISRQGWYGLPKGRRAGFFPTLSAGWTLSEEQFLRGNDIVNHLKVRGSLGRLGNYRGISAFSYMGNTSRESGVFTAGDAMENSLYGMYESAINNPTLTFEKSLQGDIGVDATLLHERLSLTADFFSDRRSDIVMADNRYSTVLGYHSSVDVTGNLGAMSAHGIELSATWRHRFDRKTLIVGGNILQTWSTVLADGNTIDDHPYLNAIGYPNGRRLGYVAEGIFQSYDEIAAHATQSWSKVKPGDVKYKDINGDGVINTSDRVPIGYGTIPELSYALNASLNTGKWTFSILFQGVSGTSRVLGDADVQAFQSYGTIYAHQLDFWTPENPDAAYPRLSLSTANANNNLTSTITVVDASYLRLKRLEVNYRLPSFGPVSTATAFVAGYNLLTISSLSYKDPEYPSGNSHTPLTRNISAGIRLNL